MASLASGDIDALPYVDTAYEDPEVKAMVSAPGQAADNFGTRFLT